MAHDPSDKPFRPMSSSLRQNPAPSPPTTGQGYLDGRRELTNEIMAAFRAVIPSNYVALTNGPWYSLQFQAMAEQLAEVQIHSAEILKDSMWDFTRTDFLWGMLGQFIFPGATDKTAIPQIDGDLVYREFLHQMVEFLLRGATKTSIEGGLEALNPNVISTVVERYLESSPRDPQGAYTLLDQFTIDVFIEGLGGGFPDQDPITTQENAKLVLEALKPAHVLFSYGHLFRDTFGTIARDDDGAGEGINHATVTLDLDTYYYDDTRKYCLGARSIVGSLGETLSDRTLFSDSSFSFSSIRVGARLRVLGGVNAGFYRVVEKLTLPAGSTPTPTAYTVSSGGSGSLQAISDQVVEDPAQDWGTFAPDTTITLLSGGNAGTYRLDTVLGPHGGPVGGSGVSGTQVRLSPSTLRVDRRMLSAAAGQSYEVDVDRLGVRVPQVTSGEDVSVQFYL